MRMPPQPVAGVPLPQAAWQYTGRQGSLDLIAAALNQTAVPCLYLLSRDALFPTTTCTSLLRGSRPCEGQRSAFRSFDRSLQQKVGV